MGVERPIFLCDAMLGSLCRWMRFLGLDTEYGGVEADDDELLERSVAERRWLLTMDRRLAARGPRTMLVRSSALEDQLVEVVARLDLEPETSLAGARCSVCNGRLEEVDREEVEAAVPPYVHATALRFRRCAGCGRIFWPGTHGPRIEGLLRRVVERARRERP